MRTIAIGDIHGCIKALEALLDAIRPAASDRLIFLGDYVDRGPDSRSVIDRLIELVDECETVYLLGNHEIMFRGALSGLAADLWLQAGGQQTVNSYGGRLESVPQSHRDFLFNLLPYYETASHAFVHANYEATLPFSEQQEEFLYWYHLTDYVPGPHRSGKHVILGHTPQTGGEIGFYGHFTCLDTCCFGGNWLSAMEVNSGEVWQFTCEGHARRNLSLRKYLWQKAWDMLASRKT